MADRSDLETAVIRVPDTLEAVNAHFHREGMTDGLPIVPPTREAVDGMLAYTDRDPQDVIAVLPPYKGQATVEKIAVNGDGRLSAPVLPGGTHCHRGLG